MQRTKVDGKVLIEIVKSCDNLEKVNLEYSNINDNDKLRGEINKLLKCNRLKRKQQKENRKTKEKGIENVKQENGVKKFFYGKIKQVTKCVQKI